jgi:rhodanese-related sulfurtransferase
VGEDVASQSSTNRWTAPALGVGVAVVIGYFALGMPGMDHTGGTDGSMAGMDHSAADMAYELLDPGQFEERIGGDAFLVNVHSPYDGEIEGTSAFIAASDIRGSTALPEDLDAPILVYCRTGRMSVDAADALVERGYSRAAVLDGGLAAWEASGRPVALDAARL